MRFANSYTVVCPACQENVECVVTAVEVRDTGEGFVEVPLDARPVFPHECPAWARSHHEA